MDTFSDCLSGPSETSKFDHSSISVTSVPNLTSIFQTNHDHDSTNTLLLHASDLGTLSPDSEEETFDISNFKNPLLKCISDFLLDESQEGKNCMLGDSLALQSAEKSFFDVLNPMDPPSSNQLPLHVYQKFEYYRMPESSVVHSFSDTPLVSDSLMEMQSLRHFRQAGEENKFLSNGNFDIIDEQRHQKIGLKGKKSRQREDEHDPEEGRRTKQSVVSADDSEPQDLFDKVLCCADEHHQEWESFMKNEGIEKLQNIRLSKGSKTICLERQQKYEEEVDLTTMLNNCARAVASYEQGTASELLKKIRQHSSPHGHPTQRLAHYFAYALEARLNGTRSPSFSPFYSMQTSAAETLQVHKVLTASLPFRPISEFLANRTIMKLAENETWLHIIDFGISYGKQWPYLIQHLSKRPNGPPKLHITAIELPEPGFRPAERIEETGRSLARYCAKFNVPFEYNAIAKKWETIQPEDLKIVRNELVVVNCIFRLRHIPDETVMENSPRDVVLKLIRSINPALFIHGIVNGTYNTPFFATRFKEALLQYYASFEIFEATRPREDWRMMFEKEIYGKDIMNIIACEGVERMESPETYKKWQIRNVRAGFKQLPLDQELLKEAREKSKFMGSHKHFRIDEDGHWMVHGWKGRVLTALSFWKPA